MLLSDSIYPSAFAVGMPRKDAKNSSALGPGRQGFRRALLSKHGRQHAVWLPSGQAEADVDWPRHRSERAKTAKSFFLHARKPRFVR